MSQKIENQFKVGRGNGSGCGSHDGRGTGCGNNASRERHDATGYGSNNFDEYGDDDGNSGGRGNGNAVGSGGNNGCGSGASPAKVSVLTLG